MSMRVEGFPRVEIEASLGISAATIDQWCSREPMFKARWKAASDKALGNFVPTQVAYDDHFVYEYLGFDTPEHLREIRNGINDIQALATRDKEPKAILILSHPDSAKSTEIENFLSHRIAIDPNVRTLLISKTMNAARKRTGRIQRRLTDRSRYASFIDTFGPFKAETREDARPWRSDYFTVIAQDSGERDYTLEALGIQGQVYGNRAEIIVLDDIADLQNQTPAEIAKQLEWIQVEVISRLSEDGILIVIGTHMRERDIYIQLEELGIFDLVIKFPALTSNDKGEIKALWPQRYPVKRLLNIKEKRTPRIWELVWQQNPLPSVGAVFTQESIESCYDRERYIGHIPDGSVLVAGVDPSTGLGFSAGVVFALKRHESGELMRYLVDIWNEQGLTGDGGDRQAGVIQFIVELCREYRIKTLCVEDGTWMALINNSFSLHSQLHRLGVHHRGIKASDVTTGRDAIGQLSGLFNHRLINVPASQSALEHLREFHNQLLTYTGEKQHWRKVFDILKAFRMAEWAVREYEALYSSADAKVDDSSRPAYMKNRRLQAVS